MPRKRQNRSPNTNKIKATNLYYVNELAMVLDVHVNTLSNMIKAGMKTVEGSYPYIIRGQFAIDYIKDRKQKARTQLQQDEIYCPPCRTAFSPKSNAVTLVLTAPKRGNLQSNCTICSRTANRFISLKDLPEFQKVMNIVTLQDLPLREGVNNSGICETKEV